VTGKLDPEAKRLRKLTEGGLADEVGGLEAHIAALKSEAIRRWRRRRALARELVGGAMPRSRGVGALAAPLIKLGFFDADFRCRIACMIYGYAASRRA
jgi:hypothetical protein